MHDRLAHWLAQSFGELRALGPYETAALITGGSLSSLLVALVWLFQHHHEREARS